MDIKGKLFKILPVQIGQGKNGEWKKQEFVIETPGTYPKKVCFSMWGDKIDFLSSLSENEEVTVSFDIESREFKERWYTDARAWKIEKGSSSNSFSDEPPMPTSDMVPPVNEEDDGELPF